MMGDHCKLRADHDQAGAPCDGEACVFWRAVSHVSESHDAPSGCAVQHYELLGDTGVAQWLLSVKERVERTARAEEPAKTEG